MSFQDFKDFIEETVEDLVTLEVATLTNKNEEPLSLTTELKGTDKTTYDKAKGSVDTARSNLLTLLREKEELERLLQKLNSQQDGMKEEIQEEMNIKF